MCANGSRFTAWARLATVAMMAASLGVAAFGCSHSSPPPSASAPAAAAKPPPSACSAPEPLHVSLTASARLNPGEKGEALATVVRIYQLKGVGKMMGVSFDDLLDHDKDTLADDFVTMQEVTINPGDKLEPPIVRNADARYVLAVALFRQPTGTTWKVTKRLNSPDPDYCHTPPPAKGTQAANDGTVRLFLDENRIELR
jgi:type VI secretion system VasD/TssJ family lipoprotein